MVEIVLGAEINDPDVLVHKLRLFFQGFTLLLQRVVLGGQGVVPALVLGCFASLVGGKYD